MNLKVVDLKAVGETFITSTRTCIKKKRTKEGSTYSH